TKKYPPLKSALIIGVLCGSRHAPLLFLSDYTGADLIKYITLFMIGIISVSIIMTLFYNLNRNLVIPIVFHQLFNFFLVMIKIDLLDILVYVMLSYLVVVIILTVINPYTVGLFGVLNRSLIKIINNIHTNSYHLEITCVLIHKLKFGHIF